MLGAPVSGLRATTSDESRKAPPSFSACSGIGSRDKSHLSSITSLHGPRCSRRPGSAAGSFCQAATAAAMAKGTCSLGMPNSSPTMPRFHSRPARTGQALPLTRSKRTHLPPSRRLATAASSKRGSTSVLTRSRFPVLSRKSMQAPRSTRRLAWAAVGVAAPGVVFPIRPMLAFPPPDMFCAGLSRRRCRRGAGPRTAPACNRILPEPPPNFRRIWQEKSVPWPDPGRPRPSAACAPLCRRAFGWW